MRRRSLTSLLARVRASIDAFVAYDPTSSTDEEAANDPTSSTGDKAANRPNVPTCAGGLQPASEAALHSLELLEGRVDGLDTKAGVALAAAGLLVSLAAKEGGILHLAAISFAGATAFLAALSILPRAYPVLYPQRLRSYVTWTKDEAQLKILDTRIAAYNSASKSIQVKGRLLQATVGALFLAVLFTALSAGLN